MIFRRWLASVRTRLRSAAAEREFDDELRTHLEMAVEENLARGMSEREARRAAHRDLGGVTAVREARCQADSLYWLDTLLQDLRYGARVLRRSPRFTVAVVLVLGLGVGMTTAVFAIVDSAVLNAVPFAEAHRLVELHRFGPTGGGPSQPAAMVESWRNEAALFDGVEAYVRVERVFTGGDEPETLQGARISPGLLPLLGVAPELGRRSTSRPFGMVGMRFCPRIRSLHRHGRRAVNFPAGPCHGVGLGVPSIAVARHGADHPADERRGR